MLSGAAMIVEGIKSCDILKNEIDNYPDLSKHHSFMKQHLTRELYARYHNKATGNRVTLDQCIQTGVDDPTLDVGMVAGDEECYALFNDLFYPVIRDYHDGYDPYTKTHPTNLPTRPQDLPIGRLDDKYVISSRVRTGRSIRGFPYSPTISRQQRRQVERIMQEAFSEIRGEIQGKYYPCMEMTKDETDQLVADHFLFAKPASDFARNACMGRDWPDARGIYFNESKNFLVWVNEEDHMRIMAMQKGGDLRAIFMRFCDGVNQIGSILESKGYEFQRSPNLGYMCTCPTNLGTAMRSSVHIKLTKLSQHARFGDIIKKLRLEKRGTSGEYQPSAAPDIFDISNLDRLGKSELQLIQLLYDGVQLLIKMEKLQEQGLSIDHLIPE